VTTDTVKLLTPEIVLVTASVAIFVAGAFLQGRATWCFGAAGALLLAALGLDNSSPCEVVSGGGLSIDKLAVFARWTALAVGMLLVLLAWRRNTTSEYVGALLLAVAGLSLVVGSSDLVLLFLGLELISIPTYILLYLDRHDAAGQEATLKYFFLSLLASAFLLYGFSFLYGVGGSTDLRLIAAGVAESNAGGFSDLAKIALVLIVAALGFKISAVPFHFYAPDVYQGTSHANAALLSVLPKIAGMVVLLRVLLAMPGVEHAAWIVTVALAVVTMTVGNVMALWQNNIRRLLAYSSIAHAGYLLIGLAVALAAAGGATNRWGNGIGVSAILFYLAVYAVATIGAFAALAYLGSPKRQVDGVDELAGLGRTRPWPAVVLAVCMFSLAGIPPLAGFWGKLTLFAGALGVQPTPDHSVGLWLDGHLQAGFVVLAVVGMLNAAVAAAYYLRVVATMYFRAPLGTPKAEGGAGPWVTMTLCAVLVLAVGFLPGLLLDRSNQTGDATIEQAAAWRIPAQDDE